MRDKDGVSALTLICELAAQLKAEGRTLQDVLDDLARTHGLHATAQVSVRVTDLSDIATAMERLRSSPPDHPGWVRRGAGRGPLARLGAAPPTDGLRYTLAEAAA